MVAAGAGRNRPAADHGDHARLPRLREEHGAQRVDVGLELAGKGPARVVQVERRALRLARRGLDAEVDVGERRPGRRQEHLRRDLPPERRDVSTPFTKVRRARDEVAPGRPVADGGERHGLVARPRAVRELPEPQEPGLPMLLDERPPDRAHRLAELLHLPPGHLVHLVDEDHAGAIARSLSAPQAPGGAFWSGRPLFGAPLLRSLRGALRAGAWPVARRLLGSGAWLTAPAV